MSFEIDDPRLTAFALGELDEADRPEIERIMADHPEAARQVEQVRLTARWLTERLHEEQTEATAAVAASPPLDAPTLQPLTAGEPSADSPSPSPEPETLGFWRRSFPTIRPILSIAAVLMLGTVVGLSLLPGFQSRREQVEIPDLAREPSPSPLAAAPIAPEQPASIRARAAGESLGVPGQEAEIQIASRGRLSKAESELGLSVARFDVADNAPAGSPAPADKQAGGYPGAPGGTKPGQQARGFSLAYNQGRQGQQGQPFRRGQGPQGQGQQGQQGQGQQGQQGQELSQAGRMAGAMGEIQGGMLNGMMGRSAEGQGQALQPESKGRLYERTASDARLARKSDEAMPQLRDLQDFQQEARQAELAEEFGAMAADSPAAAAPAAVDSNEAVVAVEENPFVLVGREAVSTFSIDVDTASYSIVRRSLMLQNQLPAPESVRIEELLNYFPYQDAPPPAGSPDPFAIHVEVARCPWNAGNRLARIGIAGKAIVQEARKPSNLIFLVDVSGSMDQPNKLPLVQWGLQKLVEQLGENDRVAIVVYAGSSGLVLPSTSCVNKAEILAKLEQLRAGGSTNGGAGIQLAYDLATADFINNGINRVILATDGDFNVGVTNQDELVRLIESKAKAPKPVFLTVLGFGMDNLKDDTLEKLADKGNGHYAYVDGPEEAYKVLVEEMGATLDVIAKDVKIQVEFKPEQVKAYRLIGYENRVMANEDFANDQKDAGEIGAGHHVTALYEIVPTGTNSDRPAAGGPEPDAFVVRLRYKQPEADVSALIERPVVDRGLDYSEATDDFKFASSVAGFGMLLRNSPSVGSLTYSGVIELASPTLAHDPSGYRKEFMGLVQRARDLHSPPLAAPVEP